jgi:Xaa-Pro aminopeptidase
MIELRKVEMPAEEKGLKPVFLTDETMESRRSRLSARMAEEHFDTLVIYADMEHGGNFEYLTGFLPRFEEALLIYDISGKAELVLGNENLNKASKSLTPAPAFHMPHFSLPNQPMETKLTVAKILEQTMLKDAVNIGIVGWKNFTSRLEYNSQLFEIPSYLMDAIRDVRPNSGFRNAGYLFIGENGVRTTNNANEFAHYEFGASLAGNGMLRAMKKIDIGVSEMELGSALESCGQRNSVVTIAAAGPRFVRANMYPSDKKVELGETISLTVGYKGGLQSRNGYAVHEASELPEECRDYMEKVAAPYQNTVAHWLETIHVGMKGGELYDEVEKVLPKEQYGWKLNPGHLCADEEWLSSPVYRDSEEVLKSGMLFQIDIIPSVSGYCGASCESGVLLADETLRKQISVQYPEVWNRIVARQKFMREVLGIKISDEVLPTSIATALFKPYMLGDKVLIKTEN